MADIGNRLKIKYGLGQTPTRDQQSIWATATYNLVAQGYSREDAGRLAARQLFADFGRNVYASESDTIEMLLRQIADK
jgi:hypothetical protein